MPAALDSLKTIGAGAFAQLLGLEWNLSPLQFREKLLHSSSPNGVGEPA